MEQSSRAGITAWSMFFTALAALQFWIIWYQLNGSVPVPDSVHLTGDWSVKLPFSIARPWDIVFLPLFTAAYIRLFTAGKIMAEGRRAYACLVICAALGIVSTAGTVMIFGALYSPISGILVGSAAMMFTVYWLSSDQMWHSLLSCFLGFGLIHGAFYGFWLGLVAAAMLLAVLMVGVVCLLVGERLLLRR